MSDNERILLKNVRLSFPSLFKRSKFKGKEGKFEATFLIPKSDKKTLTKINNAINSVLEENKLKRSKFSSDKLCLKDGDASENESYFEHFSLKSGNNNRPAILDSNRTPLVEEDADRKMYPGCYVNAIIDFWFQNNDFGKRVNSNLYGVQFYKHGERLGSGLVDVTNDFESYDEDEDEDNNDDLDNNDDDDLDID